MVFQKVSGCRLRGLTARGQLLQSCGIEKNSNQEPRTGEKSALIPKTFRVLNLLQSRPRHFASAECLILQRWPLQPRIEERRACNAGKTTGFVGALGAQQAQRREKRLHQHEEQSGSKSLYLLVGVINKGTRKWKVNASIEQKREWWMVMIKSLEDSDLCTHSYPPTLRKVYRNEKGSRE